MHCRDILLFCTISAILLIPFPWVTLDDEGEIRQRTGQGLIVWSNLIGQVLYAYYISAGLIAATVLVFLRDSYLRRLPRILPLVFLGISCALAIWTVLYVALGYFREEFRTKPRVRISVDTAAILTVALATLALVTYLWSLRILSLFRAARSDVVTERRAKSVRVSTWLLIVAAVLAGLGTWRLSVWAVGPRDWYLDGGPSWLDIHDNELWLRDAERAKAQVAAIRKAMNSETDANRRQLLSERLFYFEVLEFIGPPNEELLRKDKQNVEKKIASAREDESDYGAGLLLLSLVFALAAAFVRRRARRSTRAAEFATDDQTST